MKTRKALLALAIVAALTTIIVVAVAVADEDIGKDEQEKVVALADMPQPVQDTILKESKGFDLNELLEVTTDEGVFYEAEWLDGGDEVSILMTPDGKVIDREREKADNDEDDEEDDD